MSHIVDCIMPLFRSQRWDEHNGRAVAVVGCDRERDRENTGLIGETVVIDDGLYVVRGVERFLPATPISEGETIALHVDPY